MGTSSTFDTRLLALHHDRLRGFVVALLGDEHGADDALQEVWIRALGGAPREPRVLGAWLRTVARRVVWNHQRANVRRRDRERLGARGEALPSSADLLERVDLQRRVLGALESLAEPHRSLLHDHYFHGISIPEIAARDGLSVHTVRDRVQRARAAMRRALQRTGLDERDVLPAALLAAPGGRSSLVLLTSSLAMKKTVLFAVGVLVVALTFSLAMRAPIVGSEVVVQSSSRGPVELAPLEADTPEPVAHGERRLVPVEAPKVTAVAASPGDDLDWVVRGRVEFMEGAAGQERPIVRLRLSAHDGYDLEGPAFATTELASGADGSIVWALQDPERTVSIGAELLDAPGHSVYLKEHHLAIHGEGPVTSLNVWVKPRDAWIAGTVRASASAPNPGAPIGGARVVYNDAETTSEWDGSYRIAVPSLGYGSLKVEAAGFQRGWSSPKGLSAGGETRVDVALDPEVGPEGRVFGFVRSARGAALADALVACGIAREKEVRTDSAGYYELHGVDLRGDWMVGVKASHRTMASQEQFLSVPAGKEPGADGTQLDFELVPGSRVEGVVLDSAGAPVRGASVWTGPQSDLVANQRVYSDDDGAFVLVNVAPGSTLIGLRKAGVPSHEQNLEVPEGGEPLDIVLQLARTVPLRGRIVDGVGAPLALVRVTATWDDYEFSATTDEEGGFEIACAAETEIRVTATRQGWISTTVDHVLDDEPLELTMQRIARLTGQVLDAATGSPIETFLVRLAPSEDEAHGAWFDRIESSWLYGGYRFSSFDGRWSTDEKDPIRRGAWTYVEVEAAGYEVLRLGPLQVPMVDPMGGAEWVHRLVRK